MNFIRSVNSRFLVITVIAFASALFTTRSLAIGPLDSPPELGANLDAVAKAILPWVEDQIPFAVSPDAKQLIVKPDLADGSSELLLEDIGTKRVLGRYTTGFPLLINWRPNSDLISFVQDENGDHQFHLLFWTPKDGKVVVPDAPILPQASRPMYWSPNGKYLGFLVRNSRERSDQLRLLDYSDISKPPKIIIEASSILDFGWAPDGSRLAFSLEGTKGELQVINVETGDKRTVVVAPGSRINHLSWMYNGHEIAVTCREQGQGRFTTQVIDLETDKSRILASPEGVVGSQYPLPDGRLLFSLFSEQGANLMLADGRTPVRPFGFPDGVSWKMSIDEANNNALISYTSPIHPRGLYAVGLDDDTRRTLIYQGGSLQDFVGVAPSHVNITLKDGRNIPIYLWRAKTRPARGLIIKFPVNHRDSPSSAFNGGNQYLIQEGYDYISFGFQSKAGPGTADENRVKDEDVLDALAIIDYANITLGIPRNKTVLFGESNATVFVVRTAESMNPKEGGLVLRGVTRFIGTKAIPSHHFTIAALQGANDPFTPNDAKICLEGIFGENAFSGRRGLWRILAQEGHSPRLLWSQALISAAVYQVLSL